MPPGVIEINPDKTRLARLLFDTPFGGQGSNDSRDDFGGPASCRCAVRLRDKDYDLQGHPDSYYENAFGMYLGEHGGKWVVAVYHVYCLGDRPNAFQGFVEYETLGGLKHYWELD